MSNFRFPAIALALVFGLVLAGCGSSEKETPNDCFVNSSSFSSSLRQAPEEVLLGGNVSISDCLVRNQSDGDLLRFGEVAVNVATEKGVAISGAGPDGIKAAIDGGYLVGAMEKGGENSEGIHATLIERVRNAVVNGLNGASESAKGHYEAGYEAGKDVG